jgi:hypothetical protein
MTARLGRPRHALLTGLPCERCGHSAYALKLGRNPRIIHIDSSVPPCPGPVTASRAAATDVHDR